MTALQLNDNDRLITLVEEKRATILILRGGIRQTAPSALMSNLRSREYRSQAGPVVDKEKCHLSGGSTRQLA